MKKIIFFLLMAVISYASPKGSYRVYHYIDSHYAKMVVNHKVSYQTSTINAKLHVRNMENNNTLYSIFWLENEETDKTSIDKNSIFSPFLVIRSHDKKEFQIQELKSLSKDKRVYQKLWGLIDLLQFKGKDGFYKFHNATDTVEVMQKNTNGIYSIKHLKQYDNNNNKYDIKYISSDINIFMDKNSSIWNKITAKEKIRVHIDLIKTSILDKREFSMSLNDKGLPKDHWFFSLSTDITSWKFKKKRNPVSLIGALANYEKNHKEMLSIFNDNGKFQKWVEEHMNFLQYLSTMLESKTLDNEVSKALFAKLGYVDSWQSTQILSQVLLNDKLNNTERFRSLMGFKNTSAPLDDDLLNGIIEYGLFSTQGNDMIQNATGMLIGTLARERIERVPEQYEQLSEAIINAINYSRNKVVALNAAGNMLQTASSEVIQTVDNILMNDTDTLNRQKSAEALTRIGKSNLETTSFQQLINKENNSDTVSQLIRASATAKDFKSNNEFKQHLVNIAANRAKVPSNRLAALETLDEADFGKIPDNKKNIRKMMLNEKNADVLKMLKKLYREPFTDDSL